MRELIKKMKLFVAINGEETLSGCNSAVAISFSETKNFKLCKEINLIIINK